MYTHVYSVQGLCLEACFAGRGGWPGQAETQWLLFVPWYQGLGLFVKHRDLFNTSVWWSWALHRARAVCEVVQNKICRMCLHMWPVQVFKKTKKKNKKPKKKETRAKKRKKNKQKEIHNNMLQVRQLAFGPPEGKKFGRKSHSLGRPGRRMLFCTFFLPLLLPATASVTAVAVECKSCLSLSSLGNYTRHSPEVTNFGAPWERDFPQVSSLKLLTFDCLGQQSNVFGAAAAEQFALTKVTVFVTSSVRRQPSSILASMLGCFLPCLVCCPRPPVAG